MFASPQNFFFMSDAISFFFFFLLIIFGIIYFAIWSYGITMTAIKFQMEWWDLISKMSRFEFLAYFFHHFCIHFRSPWPWPKVSNFNKVWASTVSNHLVKTASKSVHRFGWNFVHKNSAGQTDRQTHRQTAVKI